jgi:hypothetical protein
MREIDFLLLVGLRWQMEFTALFILLDLNIMAFSYFYEAAVLFLSIGRPNHGL